MTTTVLHDTNHVRMIEAQHRDELKLFYRGVMERTAAVEPADVLAAHLCVDADVLRLPRFRGQFSYAARASSRAAVS